MAARKKSTGKAGGGKRSGKSAVPPVPTDATLKQAVEGQVDDIAPAAALRALVGRGAAPPALLGRIAKEPEQQTSLRTTAAVALGRTSTAGARRALLALLEADDPQVVRRAAEGLGRIGGEEAFQKLKALRPRDPVVKDAVETAKTVLAYRLDAKAGRLSPPDPSARVPLVATMRAQPLEVRALGPEAVEEMGPRLAPEVPALPVARTGALELDCGRHRYRVVFHRDLAKRGGLSRLGEANAVMGALLEHDRIDDQWFLAAYLLTHPGPGRTVRLFVMKGSGVVTYAGELTLESDGEARFTVEALKTRYSLPIELHGRIEPGSLEVRVDEARVATQPARSQPPAKRPRQIKARR